MTTRSINTDLMLSHPLVQRQLNLSRVQKIVREFDSQYLSSFHVVEDGDTYLVVDGQHRLAAIKKLQELNKLSTTEVFCHIIPKDTSDDLGKLKQYFDKVNEGQKLSQADKFKVEVKVGQEAAIRARDVADELGYSLTARKAENTRTLSFGAWKDAFIENEEAAKQALSALHRAYLPRGSFTMAVFTSVFEFINLFEDKVDQNKLIAGLKHVGSEELNSKSRGKNRTINGRKAVRDAYESS
jgi:hypothetical protein